MNFSFTGKQMDVGSSLTQHAMDACVNTCKKYGCDLLDVSIVMGKESFLYITDISMKAADGHTFKATSDSKDPYSSFDSTIHKIVTQIKKHKGINKAQERSGSLPEFTADTDGSGDGLCIINESVYPELMSVKAAIALLEHADHPFIIFKNMGNNPCEVSMLYRRKDGKIVVIISHIG